MNFCLLWKDDELLDKRENCFYIQTWMGETSYFSVGESMGCCYCRYVRYRIFESYDREPLRDNYRNSKIFDFRYSSWCYWTWKLCPQSNTHLCSSSWGKGQVNECIIKYADQSSVLSWKYNCSKPIIIVLTNHFVLVSDFPW